jgi:hypothetical protein
MNAIVRSEFGTSHERPSTTIHTAIRANNSGKSLAVGPFFRIYSLEGTVGKI